MICSCLAFVMFVVAFMSRNKINNSALSACDATEAACDVNRQSSCYICVCGIVARLAIEVAKTTVTA